MGAIWVISDTHFYHTNICSFDRNRLDQAGYSFVQTVEQYNEMLIRNINMCVAPGDTLYILGDFCFGGYDKIKEIYNKLHGRKILVLGNHDKYTPTEAQKRVWMEEVYQGPIYAPGSKGKVILSHYPVREAYNNPYIYNLHGHIHGGYIDPKAGNFINISAGMNQYMPVRLDHLITKALNSTKSRREHWLEEWYASEQIFLDTSRTDMVLDEKGKLNVEATKNLKK